MAPAGKAQRGKLAAAGGAAALGAAALYWYHKEHVVAAPRLWVGEGALRDKVLPHLRTLLRPFNPTPWASGNHAQTFLGLLRTVTMHNSYSRQLILTADGATLGLDWFEGCDAPGRATADTPILLVCHGINGGSHEGYCRWACAAAASRGWRAVVLNYRGCNGLPFTAPRGYAATMTHDVFTAVYSVRARFPDAPIVAVGYSLGGLLLTKYVAEADSGLHIPGPGQPRLWADGSGLAAAAVVSSPVSLFQSSANMSSPTNLNYLYNLAVAYKLREHLELHREDIRAITRFDVDRALQAWTVQDIEEQGGMPDSFGFTSRQQYYEATNSLEHLPHITTPTLVLLSEDDPFLGVVPDLECAGNPNTLLALTKRGGHVAFLQGTWPLGVAYMDEAVMDFFGATLEHLYGMDPRVVGAEANPATAAERAAMAAAAAVGVPPAAWAGAAAGAAAAAAPWTTTGARTATAAGCCAVKGCRAAGQAARAAAEAAGAGHVEAGTVRGPETCGEGRDVGQQQEGQALGQSPGAAGVLQGPGAVVGTQAEAVPLEPSARAVAAHGTGAGGVASGPDPWSQVQLLVALQEHSGWYSAGGHPACRQQAGHGGPDQGQDQAGGQEAAGRQTPAAGGSAAGGPPHAGHAGPRSRL